MEETCFSGECPYDVDGKDVSDRGGGGYLKPCI